MITENQIEQIVEKLIERVQEANTKYLKSIGSSIKKIRDLTPTQAQQLAQILKYGGRYEDIIKELSKIIDTNVDDIDKIFSSYAKKDQSFYEKFYKYKDIPFIPFEENAALKTQTQALSNIVKNEMYNFTRSNVLGYTINGKFYNLRDTYNKLLDEALVNVGQGKETFESAMKNILEQIGGSGLKTLNYESGRNVRLDSAIRMQLKGRLRELHNENQKIIGEEIGYDGWEISVHTNPAPDHELAQGRQFSIEEYNKLQNGLEAVDYIGKRITLDHDGKNGYRPISEMNCYHYAFTIVLGVSKPEYSNKELQEIINNNKKGFEFEGKHYSMYEGTQMQRNLEREIRKQKDIQILAKESGNNELVGQAQENIRILTNKYKELNDVSGLPPKVDRLRVGGYRKVKGLDNYKGKPVVDVNGEVLVKEEMPKTTNNFDFNEYQVLLSQEGIIVSDDINKLDKDLVESNLIYLEDLSNRYGVSDRQELHLEVGYGHKRFIGTTYYTDNRIELNPNYYIGDKLVEVEKRGQNTGWHNKVKEENLGLYTLSHEYGHAVENNYARKYIKEHYGIDTDVRRSSYKYMEDKIRKEIDKDIRDSLFAEIRKEEKLSITEIKNKYFSGYGKSKNHYEWFAETFAQMELGEENALTRAMKNWLERNYK